MKRTVKPIIGEALGDYWRRCNGRFLDGWYLKAFTYAKKNGAELNDGFIVGYIK